MKLKRGTGHAEFLRLRAQETDDCILWPYSRTASGYGAVWVAGKLERASRLSCEIAHGPAPTDQKYDAAHSCRNRHCFNPRHLRWATRKENMRDMVQDGTHNRGERQWYSKLTEFDVRAIRHYVKCGTKQRVLAEHYGVSRENISDIVRRKSWDWL